jgi:hypothetical protein
MCKAEVDPRADISWTEPVFPSNVSAGVIVLGTNQNESDNAMFWMKNRCQCFSFNSASEYVRKTRDENV